MPKGHRGEPGDFEKLWRVLTYKQSGGIHVVVVHSVGVRHLEHLHHKHSSASRSPASQHLFPTLSLTKQNSLHRTLRCFPPESLNFPLHSTAVSACKRSSKHSGGNQPETGFPEPPRKCNKQSLKEASSQASTPLCSVTSPCSDFNCTRTAGRSAAAPHDSKGLGGGVGEGPPSPTSEPLF